MVRDAKRQQEEQRGAVPVTPAARDAYGEVEISGFASPRASLTAQADESFAAKLSLRAFLESADPPREVARAGDFFTSIVDALWQEGVQVPADLASLPAAGLAFANATQTGFFHTFVMPRAINMYGTPAATLPQPVLSASGPDLQAVLQQMSASQFAMFERLATSGTKKAEPVVSVDLAAGLKELGLESLPLESQPNGISTDKLMAKAEKLAKSKRVPFVCVSLAMFLPPHARGSAVEVDSEEEEENPAIQTMQKVLGVHKPRRSTTFLQCLEALQRYIIAGAICKQFKYSSGLAHLAIVVQVATKAGKEGKRHSVAVAYDEKVREKWAETAYNAGQHGAFDIDAAMMVLDEKVYAEAMKTAPDPKPHSTEERESGKGGSKGKFLGVCNYCNKPGHRKIDCFQFKADQRKISNKRLNQEEGDGAPEKKFRPPWPKRS